MLFRLCSYRRPRCVAKNRFESVEIMQNRAVKKPRKLLTLALRIRGLRGKPCTVPKRIRRPLDPTKPIRRYLNPLWWIRLEPWSQTSTNKEPNWKKWSVRSLAYLFWYDNHKGWKILSITTFNRVDSVGWKYLRRFYLTPLHGCAKS